MANQLSLKNLKVLFLDIGGVLLTNGWGKDSREAAAKQFNLNFEELEKRHEMMFDVYEEGGVTLDDYIDTIVFYEERPFSKETFKNFMYRQSKLLPDMLEWFINWRKQHPEIRVFSLNNEPKELQSYRVKQYDLLRLFDGIICSCDVGYRKPDPKIYELAIAIGSVSPEECLYIDDREILTTAGKKAGLHTWTHKSFEETTAYFQSL